MRCVDPVVMPTSHYMIVLDVELEDRDLAGMSSWVQKGKINAYTYITIGSRKYWSNRTGNRRRCHLKAVVFLIDSLPLLQTIAPFSIARSQMVCTVPEGYCS